MWLGCILKGVAGLIPRIIEDWQLAIHEAGEGKGAVFTDGSMGEMGRVSGGWTTWDRSFKSHYNKDIIYMWGRYGPAVEQSCRVATRGCIPSSYTIV